MVVAVAYGTGKTRTALATDLPATNFDFIANLPAGNNEALQREVRKTFGVVAKNEMLGTRGAAPAGQNARGRRLERRHRRYRQLLGKLGI